MATNYVRGASITCAASRAEIQDMLTSHGATGFRCASRDGGTAIAFTAGHRRFRFAYTPPGGEKTGTDSRMQPRKTPPGSRSPEEASRRYWHKLSLLIRAKLDAVDEGIATFEEEFLAYMLLPGGDTVLQGVQPGVTRAYAAGGRTGLLNDDGS